MFESMVNNSMTKEEYKKIFKELKERLICRKKSKLLEYGYEEMPCSTTLFSTILKPEFCGRCQVDFVRNTNTVHQSSLSFAIKSDKTGEIGIENSINEIWKEVIEPCKLVFGMDDIEILDSFIKDEVTDIKRMNRHLDYPYKRKISAGVAENGKRMYVGVEESYHENIEDKLFFVSIVFWNHKWRNSKNGK